jgi:hypothetical protein
MAGWRDGSLAQRAQHPASERDAAVLVLRVRAGQRDGARHARDRHRTVMPVDHEREHAVGRQQVREVSQPALGASQVMDHARRIDDIEPLGRALEKQLHHGGVEEIHAMELEVVELAPAPLRLDRRDRSRRKIDADHACIRM